VSASPPRLLPCNERLIVDEWHYRPAQDQNLTPADRLRSVKRESGLLGLIGRNLWWWWVRGVLRLTEHVEVMGREHLPAAAPFVMVANHGSHLDVMVLATALPLHLRSCVIPLAAGDTFFETPVVAAFATSMMNALPLWRKNCGHHAIDTLRQRLVAEPCGYILFPEGTRTRTGQMNPFRHGIGMLVAATNVPVIPCHLDGTFDALPPGSKWPRSRHIVLRIGALIRFEHVPNERTGWETIARGLEQAVRGLAEK
jgi:1-acyl-sn-glycerol-3-phosphate acyltransferase